MDSRRDEQVTNEKSKRLLILLPVISTVLGSGALWYAWFRYNTLVSRPDAEWYGWIQIALMAFMGVLCLSATVLSISGRSSGWSVFKAGLSIVPVFLFSNLVILIFRMIQNIVQGNAAPFFERVFSQPHKLILIPVIVIALLLLGSLNKKDENKSNH